MKDLSTIDFSGLFSVESKILAKRLLMHIRDNPARMDMLIAMIDTGKPPPPDALTPEEIQLLAALGRCISADVDSAPFARVGMKLLKMML